MCRHLAYVGPSLPLRDTLAAPQHSLYRQSWAPRRQRHGTVNADGFGVGWYVPGDPAPARYRRAGPVWADAGFNDVCRVVRSTAVLAAVRSTTEGCAAEESATAPFAADNWLFSHNGALLGWPGSVAGVAATLPVEELLALEARCDSALAWALTLHRLRAGHNPGDALTRTIADLAKTTPDSRMNFLLTDGRTIAATAWGEELWYLHLGDHSLTVVSEPYDDDPRWNLVPDRHLLTGDPSAVRLDQLAPRPPATARDPQKPQDRQAPQNRQGQPEPQKPHVEETSP